MLRNSSLTTNVDAAGVIRAAAESTLGVLSLGCLIVAVLAYLFFGKDQVRVRLAVFAMIFVAVVGMGIAVLRKAEGSTGPAPPPVTSAPAAEGPPDMPVPADAGLKPGRDLGPADQVAIRPTPGGVSEVDAVDERALVSAPRPTVVSPPVSAGYSIGGITNVEVASALTSLIDDLPYRAVILSDDGMESFRLTFGSRDGDALTLKAKYGLSDQHFPNSEAATATIRREADAWICRRLGRYLDAGLASIRVVAEVTRADNLVLTVEYPVKCLASLMVEPAE